MCGIRREYSFGRVEVHLDQDQEDSEEPFIISI